MESGIEWQKGRISIRLCANELSTIDVGLQKDDFTSRCFVRWEIKKQLTAYQLVALLDVVRTGIEPVLPE